MRVKLLGLLLAAVALAALVAPAEAEVRLFKHFKADVPPGWQVIDEGEHVVFAAPNESAVVTVTIQDAQNVSAQSIAEMMSKGLKGTTPVWDAASGGYIFDFVNKENMPGKALVKVQGATALILAIMGDNPQVAGLVNSMGDK